MKTVFNRWSCLLLVFIFLLFPVSAGADGNLITRFSSSELKSVSPIKAVNGVSVTNAVDESGTASISHYDYNRMDNTEYEYEYSYRVPKFVSDSGAAREINESIFAEYENLLIPRSGPLSEIYLGSVAWECTVIDGLFLLRIDYHPYEIESAYDEYAFSSVFYFDSENARRLSTGEMLDYLGLDEKTVISAAEKQIGHDFSYYWMQNSFDEPETAMRDAWEGMIIPRSVWDFSDLWYDGEHFFFSCWLDNGSAHGFTKQIQFDLAGNVLLFPGETGYDGLPWDNNPVSLTEEGIPAGIGYPPRPVNNPVDYSMLNGQYNDVVVTRDSFYTDEKGNLYLRFIVIEKPSDRWNNVPFSSEVAWNAVVEDTYGAILDGIYDGYYTYDDPREFFDYYPSVSEVHMYLSIEGGLVTYMGIYSA